jgi:hypothetical protein
MGLEGLQHAGARLPTIVNTLGLHRRRP